jgi:hypothetical protein
MFCCWRAASAVATLLSLGATATAADFLGSQQGFTEDITKRGQCLIPAVGELHLMELQPGMTKIVKVCKPFQAIVNGNPSIADVSAINLNSIAITGKGAGLTNFVLFDEEGKVISNTKIQVVNGTDYRAYDVRARHEVRVVFFDKGEPAERRYICGQGCSAAAIDKPEALNPPGGTNAPTVPTTKSEVIYSNAPAPPGPNVTR